MGITREIFKEALTQAKKGRLEILENMLACIGEPRKQVSKYAPKAVTFMIPQDKIRDVIGAGGKTINQIIEDCNQVKIDITDEGKVTIYHTEQESIDKAKSIIEGLTKEAQVGEIYDAKVLRIEKFGAFVELFEGHDALLHVSRMSNERVEKPEDVVKIGDTITVKVIEISEKGVSVAVKDYDPSLHRDSNRKSGNESKGEKRFFNKK